MNYGQANHILSESAMRESAMRDARMAKEQAAQQQESYGGGLGGQVKSAPVVSPLQRSVEHLQKQVAHLEETLTILSTRLAIVKRPQPQEQGRAEGLATCASPLVERIDSITNHLNRLTQATVMQLELLEL